MSKNTTELVQELEQAKNTMEFQEFLKRNHREMQRTLAIHLAL